MLRRLTTRLYDNAYLLLSFMALCWAGNQVLGRSVAGHIPPIAYSFLRWSLATVIVLPFALPHVRRDWPVIRTRWRYLAFVGAIGGGLFNTLQYIALNHTTALNSLVLNSTGPIFIAMASFLIFRERLTLRQAGGTSVSMAGVLGIITKGDLDVLHTLAFNNGDLLLLTRRSSNSSSIFCSSEASLSSPSSRSSVRSSSRASARENSSACDVGERSAARVNGFGAPLAMPATLGKEGRENRSSCRRRDTTRKPRRSV